LALYVDGLPSESVRVAELVSVNQGPSGVITPATVTVTYPVEAPLGTTAVIDVSLQLVMDVAVAP
jgi:hypothetical protein